MDDAAGAGDLWRISVDTGGTFTDCVAIDPADGLRRAKVLSSSALRGRVVRVDSAEDSVEVAHDWWPKRRKAGRLDLHTEVNVVLGMRFRLLSGADGSAGENAAESRIVGVDVRKGTLLTFNAGVPEGVHAGAVFELRADEEAPILAARLVTGTPAGAALPPIRMRLGTTRGTNALLERRGSDVVLFITRGLGDLLEIGTQQRPELFALHIRKPSLLHRHVVEVDGRLAADGTVVEALDLEKLEAEAQAALAEYPGATAAVALMHSWTNPQHEKEVAQVLRNAGFEHVSRSSELAPLIKILPRAQTAVANAYLAGVMDQYLARVTAALHESGGEETEPDSDGQSRLHIMTSSGGLVSEQEFAPKESLLSGPAGGVVGAAAAGRAAGFERTIAFDMGGTSTDVSRYDGDYQYIFEHIVGDAHIVAPALAIETVAAGGGSICRVDRGLLRVGPESAGAHPGPACYGAGGPLTITDCNLLLGRLDPERFGVPVDEVAARARFSAITEQVRKHRADAERSQRVGENGEGHVSDEAGDRRHDDANDDELLEGFLEIACERMAAAIGRISVRQGYDAAEYALVAFGGAGGQHACAVAAKLGMNRVVLPADAGLLSAVGLDRAKIERFAERQVLAQLDDVDVEAILSELADEAMACVRAEGAEGAIVRRRLVQMRLAGQESTITVEHSPGGGRESLEAAFRDRYLQLYGHEPPDRAIEVESARIVASAGSSDDLPTAGAVGAHKPPRPGRGATHGRERRVRIGGAWITVPVYERDALAPDALVEGPALVVEAHSTSIIEPGWRGRVVESSALILERWDEAQESTAAPGVQAVQDAVSAGRLSAIARDMGELLQRTALSTNVKERLDFSCAILDARGQLVVNAPHVPVHLGALGVCVRSIIETMTLGSGDSVVTNHPAHGGSHLPDITIISPVHDEGGRLLAYVASRAHHAEIGGIAPGSMPTRAHTLAEEGVVIPPMYLVRSGAAQWDRIEDLLSSGQNPSRAVKENLADLRAQLAANRFGVFQLVQFAQSAGADELGRAMQVLADRAAAGVADALREHGSRGTIEALEQLDDGSPLRVRILLGAEGKSSQAGAHIDFAGSGPVHPGNLNATPAIVRSALVYVLRLLIREDLPLNEGLLRGVEVNIPQGILAPPFSDDPAACPAVAGGNVETSQRLVDTLLKALGLCACSQGTMNNIVFGTSRYGYYETVCGGAGAGPGFQGASAVHTHMTNTRITDPEILEHRYPVRLHRFAIRGGSGGAGEFRGGDGVCREIEFLEPCELSIISQHRAAGPYGMNGGADGQPGRQCIVRPGGEVAPLAGIDACSIKAGDRLVLETPGGGGWGSPDKGQ